MIIIRYTWAKLVLCAATLLLPALAHAGAATVREPAYGLPHIYGDTDAELARENGRQVARDRLGQMVLVARVARGTLYQVFGLLNAAILNDDIEARQTAYTSSELNEMFAKLPANEQVLVNEYCKGVNDTIEQIYAGSLPEPIEVTVLKGFSLGADLFGNATNISDQVDPNYLAPGGADPSRPNGGFQFTPELAVAIAILQVRNFGLGGFDEASLLSQLQALQGVHGAGTGTQIWNDLNYLVDPLAPVTVPDPTTPGFGGPLAAGRRLTQVASAAQKFPRRDYAAGMEELKQRRQQRAEFAARLGAWPTLGSYAWIIGGGKSASGWPWIGGFPQTGIQTPSIMHFMENVSAEGSSNRIDAVGMEFVGAPLILIGHTSKVAYTTTTAQLRIVDTFLEQVINENTDNVRYNDEGTPAALNKRTETFRGGAVPDATRVFWRSHSRGGDGGSRAIIDFQGDREAAVTSATANTLVSSGFDAGYGGGHVLIVGGPGAGQIRPILSATATTLTLTAPWTTVPNAASSFVAVRPANTILAVSVDSPVWLEETTAVLGFGKFQRAESVLDIRAGVRLIPSTHNFFAGDNQAFNSIGTASGNGNTGYWSSGFSRRRQGALDSRLSMDGSVANPLVVYSGTVASATATSVTATAGVFGAANLAPPAYNYRYLNPTLQGTEYIVSITTGAGAKQSRRIASNTSSALTVESEWGLTPSPGDTFEVYEIVAMPEAINPMEGYTANWNNKAATADEGENFGRQFRHIFILERLQGENSWDRAEQRQLNEDVAGLDGRGDFGRYLIPRLRQAVTAVGNGGNTNVDTVLAALEAHQAAPYFGRYFIDPVTDTTSEGALAFLNTLANQLAIAIYGDELAGAVSVPTGSRALNMVQHAIDSAAGDVVGSYAQAYAGDYFNGVGWETVVRNTLSSLSGSIPADTARSNSNYRHPLRDAFLALMLPDSAAALQFEPTLSGNRGTYEQIVEVAPTVKGEFIFPLGQSGHISGSLAGVTGIDPNFTTLHPLWRDWRFAPMLRVSSGLAAGGDGDSDDDGVIDGYEQWYFGNLARSGKEDPEKDKAKLVDEYLAGTDPTLADSDGDGIPDGRDRKGQDRLRSGFVRLNAKIKFGGTLGTDKLIFVAKLGAGGSEFDPTTRSITLTMSDDNEIFDVTIPAGTLVPNPSGKRFTYVDPTGSLGGVTKAIFVKGVVGGLATLKILAGPLDLTNADAFPHDIDTFVQIGAHSISDRRLFNQIDSGLKSTT